MCLIEANDDSRCDEELRKKLSGRECDAPSELWTKVLKDLDTDSSEGLESSCPTLQRAVQILEAQENLYLSMVH